MQVKTPLLLVVTSLLIAGAAAGSASPTIDEQPIAEVDPITVPTHIVGSPQADDCSGDAPDTTDCTTGAHLILDGSASHGFARDQGSFNGTLETRVQSLVPYRDEPRVFRCDFDEGELGDCSITGSFPGTPALFIHTCHAYQLGTETPGGDGTWSCFVEHS